MVDHGRIAPNARVQRSSRECAANKKHMPPQRRRLGSLKASVPSGHCPCQDLANALYRGLPILILRRRGSPGAFPYIAGLAVRTD